LLPLTLTEIVQTDKDRVASTHKEPTNETEIQQQIKLKAPVMLATKSDLLETHATDACCYALVCKDAFFSIDNIAITLPASMPNLLQRFRDVFPSELPPGLPLIRGIEHQIDLIPGASLPNRAAGPFNILDLKPYLGKEDELESRTTPLQEGEDDEDMDVFPSEIPPGLPPELPPDFQVSPTFNISDLKPYMGDEDEIELRTTPIQEEEDDEDITYTHTMNGPITRSRARQINLQVRSTLVNCVSELTLGAMDVLMIRNLGEDQQGLGKGLGDEEEQQGCHNRKDIKSNSAVTPSRVLGPVCTKMDAQDASGLRLRCT
jgi:hypothetical protein